MIRATILNHAFMITNLTLCSGTSQIFSVPVLVFSYAYDDRYAYADNADWSE